MLYTKIPQDKLKDNLGQFIKETFQIKECKYINIQNNCAVFSDIKANKCGFTADELISFFWTICIDHAFVSFIDVVHRQVIGIPMDRNDSSHLANIFLYMYEKTFYQKLKDNHQDEIIYKLGDMFTYQDDLIVFGMLTQRNIGVRNTYPKEMIIKNTNLSHNEVTYLDLKITIENNNYVFKTFDKRKDINIPINHAYGVFISQLIRFGFINCNLEDFKDDVIELARVMLQQGYKYHMLKIKFRQFARDNVVKWAHFGINVLDIDFVDTIIPKCSNLLV